MIHLENELRRIADDARSHGLASIDLHTIDRLLHRSAARRRDLLDYGGMLVVPLVDTSGD